MAKKVSDPTGRMLRNFVLLVIFSVAVPSLLLTGFGLIAISNEREIARKRLYETYKPVLGKVVERFKASLADLVERGDAVLDELGAFGKREVSRVGESLKSFVEKEGLAANFFVIGLDGKVLLPRQSSPLPSWQGYLPETHSAAEELEFQKRDFKGAANKYKSALSGMDNGDLQRCVVLNALGRARVKGGDIKEALLVLESITRECGEFVDSGGYNLAIGAHLQIVRLLAEHKPEELAHGAERFSAWLCDPGLSASGAQVVFAGQRAFAVISKKKNIKLSIGRIGDVAPLFTLF